MLIGGLAVVLFSGLNLVAVVVSGLVFCTWHCVLRVFGCIWFGF